MCRNSRLLTGFSALFACGPRLSRRVVRFLALRYLNVALVQVAFVVTGQGKAEVLQRILEVSALPGALPAQLVRPTDGSVTWFADLAATAELNDEVWGDAKKFPRNAL